MELEGSAAWGREVVRGDNLGRPPGNRSKLMGDPWSRKEAKGTQPRTSTGREREGGRKGEGSREKHSQTEVVRNKG